MSQLQQLKQTVNGLADAAKKAGGNLTQLDRTFSQQSSAVQQAIGGSTNGADKRVLQAIQDAQRKVKEASAAMQNAARIASDYGRSL